MSTWTWVQDSESSMKRVGYWISDKKSRRLNFGDFKTICRYALIDLIKIDLDVPLEDQGPFDVILHKLTDQIAQAGLGDEKARQRVQRLQNYVEARPSIVVLDPVQNVQKLLDRHTQYKLATKANTKANKLIQDDESLYFTPEFVELTSVDVETNKQRLRQAGVQFPFVCKPSIAHGSSFCHQMAIIFNEAGLADVRPPCVAQTFVNHNAVLYKIFVIGDQYFVVERPSLKNFQAGDQKTIFFNSHDVSKADSASFLNENGYIYEPIENFVFVSFRLYLDEGDDGHEHIAPEPQKLHQLAQAIQAKFKLDLFGVDVIIENATGRYAVIDINAFPGYDGVPEFFQVLLRLIQRSLNPDAELPTATFHPGACDECAKVNLRSPENGVISFRTVTQINGYSSHGQENQANVSPPPHGNSSVKSQETGLPNRLSILTRNHQVIRAESSTVTRSHDVSKSQT